MECSKSRVHNRENLQGTESRFKHEHEFELLMQRMQALWTELIMEWNVKARSPNLWVLAEMLQTTLLYMSVFCENNAPSSSPLTTLPFPTLMESDTHIRQLGRLGEVPCAIQISNRRTYGLRHQCSNHSALPFPKNGITRGRSLILVWAWRNLMLLTKACAHWGNFATTKKRHLRQAEFRQAVEVK